MAVTGCIRPCLVVLNCIFWILIVNTLRNRALLIGLFLVGFISWTLATNPALSGDFVSGTRYFSYTIASVGILITVAGLFGCTGAFMEGSCTLKTYIGFVVLILLIEIGGGVAAYMMREKLDDYRDSGWEDFNTETKNFLQKELKCCGFSNYTDHSVNITDLPDSCFPHTAYKNQTNLYEDGCWSKIDEWLNANTVAWIGALSGVALVEILCVVFATVMVYKIKKASKVASRPVASSGDWDDRYDRRAHRGGGGGRGYYKGGWARDGRHRDRDDYY